MTGPGPIDTIRDLVWVPVRTWDDLDRRFNRVLAIVVTVQIVNAVFWATLLWIES